MKKIKRKIRIINDTIHFSIPKVLVSLLSIDPKKDIIEIEDINQNERIIVLKIVKKR